jgi:hypothetical protein
MTTPPPTSRRRRRRWLIIPLVLLLLFAGVTAWLYVRGTWADGKPRDPGTGEPPIAQLYQPPDGRTCIRAAALLPWPRNQVWRIVTDYEHYDQFLPYLADVAVTSEKDGCHMTGEAKSAFSGYWPFAIDIREQKGEQEWSATWDQPAGKEVLVNRGGWMLIDRGKQTLLVLTLEAEVKGTPTFILRNVFLHRLPIVLKAIEERLTEESNE